MVHMMKNSSLNVFKREKPLSYWGSMFKEIVIFIEKFGILQSKAGFVVIKNFLGSLA